MKMKIKPIKIGKKFVGDNHPCYIVAEIGSNFDGSFSKAKKMIKLAKAAGADAAKFQSFTTEQILSRKGFETTLISGPTNLKVNKGINFITQNPQSLL